jgi:hypothetical protein
MAVREPRVEREGVLRAAVTAVVLCLPLALLSDIVIDEDDPSGWSIPLFLGVLLGFVAAGWVGSRSSARSPLATGALGALTGFVVVQAVGVLVAVMGDGDLAIASIIFSGLLAYGSGLTGAVLGERRRSG